jgi:glycosyltransferase involved in cell wall biosynthesis
MRIGFLSADWANHRYADAGGCTWTRCITIADALSQIGHEAIVGELGWRDDEGFVAVHPAERLNANTRGPIKNYGTYFGKLDIIVLKLFMWHEADKYIARAQEMGQTVIIDIDDFFDGLPHDNIAYTHTSKEMDPLWNRDWMIESYDKVDGLITSTQFLYDFYESRNDNAFLVRNSLNPKHFTRRVDLSGNKPTVGWAGILAWRQDDLRELQGVIGPFLDDNDLMFHHSGMLADNRHGIAELMKIDTDRLIGTTGTVPQFYSNILIPMDVGVVPLTGNKFNEAKSSLKGMEYAISGIPFIATPTHEYKLLHEDGAGLVANKKRDWVKALNKMLDPEFRKVQIENGYRTVLQKYNLLKRVYEWEDAIKQIHDSKKS